MHQNKQNNIHCSVEECAYHDKNGFCTANSIKVSDCNQKPTATSCEDTICSTFKLKNDINQFQ